MLYNFEKKIGVLYIPKTATCSLHQVLVERVELDLKEHKHVTLSRLKTVLEVEGQQIPEGSTFYCVYREPVEWFISACNYFKFSDPNFKINLLEHLGLIGELSYFDKARSFLEHIDTLNSIPIKDVISVLKKIRDTGSAIQVNTHLQLWRPQSEYLDHPNVVPLDYRDMLGSANTILRAFGADEIDHMPRLNVTKNKPHTRDNITQEDIDAIKDFYRTDYEFFEKKGISFEV